MNGIRTVTLLLASVLSMPAASAVPTNGGPYNAAFLEGGIGIERNLEKAETLARAGSPFSLSAWVRPDARQDGRVILMSIGDPAGEASRRLMLEGGKLVLRDGNRVVASSAALEMGRWVYVAAVSDGRQASLYVDGRAVGTGAAPSVAVAPRISIAPAVDGYAHFGGTMVEATVHDHALSRDEIAAAIKARPNFDLVQIWHVGVGWEWQKQANTGLWRQQDPWTLPKGKGGFTQPVAKPMEQKPVLQAVEANKWQLNGWRLAAAPEVKADGAALSRPGFDARAWYAATVPGTVLTTLVDRGVYPDPYYGLNNMAIPESLARQDYWYRTSFTLPAEAAGKALTLTFNGINYASEVWVNGRKLGGTKGAFIRGQFEIEPVAGENVVAVKVSPPPHPGIPHEQSITAGVGENGGQLAIDGPTFVATEGWDWIPGIRDRNTGIWLPVELEAHGPVRIGDAQIITDLPLPRTDTADIYFTVPVRNVTDAPRQVTVRAAFDDVTVEKTITAVPGETAVRFAPGEFPQLRVKNPRLWWPNGYGEPALHTLTITASEGGSVSDTARERFGIREVSYDLSLFDSKGKLRRVNVQTTDGKLKGEKLIDVSHEGIKQSPKGWAESLTPAGEKSPAVTDIPADIPEPHLTIRVNGVKIAARGGNWGMDDAMKRVDRARLEPYFRLQKEANLNIIRNWMGTNTEPQFYDLADEYGMMVLNDFWQSTQNFQVEPQDPQLFLENARDTVRRYQNHPSIILWFGRNEGVPYPLLNEGLDDVVAELDGTRWFTGSSNVVNLQGSGPYNYRPPVGYFTDLATGFSVETGTPSLSTLESIKAYVPDADRWPISDTLAYHDWHFAGNGDTKTFMKTLNTMFGAPTSLEDFERKAQMMNLETHKAMFEGFLGHLWTKNSGRLLWMTHPAWPSNAWQIYSWDYDTHAAYYGAKKANEPLHVQLNLPDNKLVVLNTTLKDAPGLTVETRVLGLDNRELFRRTDKVDAAANRATDLPVVPLDGILARHGMALVSLKLTDASGRPVAENFYWRGKDTAAYRALNDLPQAPVQVAATAPVVDGADNVITATLTNGGAVAALNAKLTLVNEKGERILPAFYSDNYVALLPGESRTITIRYPATIKAQPHLTLRGWNVPAQEVAARD
ncbi:glycosyl hydrolase 2 galactose-binding domain-containing protein [Pedomonas mirosovicensis]|uniref:glycosyl hydrolase 2 galactose-binding domain-containing protein n=1 Tax=Pedomonas mirosovicensis TaxID=2908641 RepID=UPI002168F347|nr:LamG-like jellyroll fold domain-containing protein [Pedomonas mirosovicensis]MCH8686226.1 glycoside hydrolase family 2 [Pedomonas mirosovicensis]